MNHSHYYMAYKNAHRTTDNKARQVVMLYDGMMGFVSQAKQAILDNNIEERYNLLERASHIIVGLQASLDFKTRGDVARVLDSFYNRLQAMIYQINRSHSEEQCDAVIHDIEAMRQAWQKVYEEAFSESHQISSGSMDAQDGISV